MLGVLLKRRVRLGSVADDRGRPFPVHDRAGLDERLRDSGEFGAFGRALRAEMPRSVTLFGWGTLGAVGVMIASLILVAVAEVAGWGGLSRAVALVLVVSIGAVLACSVATVALLAHHLGPARTRALRHVGRCLACTYDLRTLEPGDGGLTVCPECGAAWRVPSTP